MNSILRKRIRNYFRSVTFVILASLFCFNAYADNSPKHAASIWDDMQFFGSILNSNKWKYKVEVDIHSPPINNTNEIYEDTLGAGIGRVLNENQEIWAGYDVLPVIDDEGEVNLEQRLWQEFPWNIFENSKTKWLLRTRLEERKFEHASDIALRWRQRVTVTIKQPMFNHATPVIYDEIFVGLNKVDWVPHKLINQNRLFLGFIMPAGKDKSLQIGYLNQYKFNNTQDRMNHILSITFSVGTVVIPREFDLPEI